MWRLTIVHTVNCRWSSPLYACYAMLSVRVFLVVLRSDRGHPMLIFTFVCSTWCFSGVSPCFWFSRRINMVWYQCCRLFCPCEIKKTLKTREECRRLAGGGGSQPSAQAPWTDSNLASRGSHSGTATGRPLTEVGISYWLILIMRRSCPPLILFA